MAPLPAPEFDQPASSAIASFSRLVADVENAQIPRLRSCDSSLAVQQQLHAELHADLDSLARLAEELDELAPDQRGPRAKRELASLAAGFRADIARLRKEARAALLASKRAIDANAASSRAELFKRSSAARDKPASSEAKTAEDALMKTNADVTDALRRTLHLMQSELEKSVLSAQMLESSTSTLQSATAQHDVLTDLLGTSKQLVTALERTDWLDRVLIVAGLLFFVSVVLFVLKQRIVDRGIRIAFFWTRWLPSGGGGVADVEKGVLATTTTTTASLVTAATTAVTTAVAGSLSGTLLSSTFAPDLDSALPTAAAIGPELTDEDGVDSVPHDEL